MTPALLDRSVEPWQNVRAPHGLGYRIKLISQLLTRKFQEQLEPYGLTPFHWLVLCCLWEQDGLATSAVGEQLRQVGGTLTGVIDRMEERGLVRRERDVQDRRIWRIWLTEEGKQLEDVLPARASGIREQALQGFSESEQQLLSDWVDRIIANLS
ncbi:MarR family transcriptional regulator [Leptolyngbya sp. FACHB-16]|uniref:MarR family winged helix-turn-helix transcriptional regulator n=1 Tax=unclassified Leptolyngbya TaxID=2650499 RepID=UPI00168252A8|nr:MarR family transcriptional regulator [Leptolyngbya sp. FACHB-16]MBD2153423.1 MarR family transcriptional regulator [Leptolyngbya sp. FACHB-16]